MKRLHLFLLVITTALLVPPSGSAPYGRAYAQGQQDAAKKWDVTQPFGPTTALAFDTDEATWVNVDVSPDGRIVFDVLGDLYVMPIGGTGPGRDRDHERPGVRHAAALQPRRQEHRVLERPRRPLEHLGRWRVTAAARARCSKEKRWFVNSPAWSPDGQYIYARHHFVQGAIARRGRDLDVPRQRRRRPPGHREERLAEGRRRARALARTDGTSTTARTSRPGRRSNTTRIPTAPSTRSSGATSATGRSAPSCGRPADRSRRASPRTGRRWRSCAACG